MPPFFFHVKTVVGFEASGFPFLTPGFHGRTDLTFGVGPKSAFRWLPSIGSGKELVKKLGSVVGTNDLIGLIITWPPQKIRGRCSF